MDISFMLYFTPRLCIMAVCTDDPESYFTAKTG